MDKKEQNLLYRAFECYKKERKGKGIEGEIKQVKLFEPSKSYVFSEKAEVEINEDWIEAIEQTFKFISKAIEENRQFIRSYGEVVPIEKVKRVSRDSVEHLSKHSDLIDEKEDDDLIPKKLYMIERLTDHAVYENRFLYMLLCFIRDFVSLRLRRIEELAKTLKIKLNLEKNIFFEGKTTDFRLILDENRANEFVCTKELAAIIERIDDIYKTTLYFLNTPLMQEVAKAPVLKPPITKTNVLKMNKNFLAAMKLYDFIRCYEGDGYSYKIISEKITPLDDEFCDLTLLSSFLSYKYAMNLTLFYKEEYLKEENRLKIARKNKQKEELNKLRERLDGKNKDEYILLLENHLGLAQDINQNIEKNLTNLMSEKIREISLGYQTEIEKLHADYHNKINTLCGEFGEKIDKLNAEHQNQIDEFIQQTEQLKAENIKKLEQLKTEHLSKINALTASHNQEIAKLEQENHDNTAQIAALNQTVDNKTEECIMLSAHLRAMRVQQNIKEDIDFTKQENFDLLEAEHNALKRFLKENWARTKKEIRKQVLFTKNKDKSNDKSDKKQ